MDTFKTFFKKNNKTKKGKKAKAKKAEGATPKAKEAKSKINPKQEADKKKPALLVAEEDSVSCSPGLEKRVLELETSVARLVKLVAVFTQD